MVRFIVFYILIITVSAGFTQIQLNKGQVISTSERWSGTIVIEGDVLVTSSGRLTIDPGSRILFRPHMDRRKSGRDKTRSELIVLGVLMAKGQINNKIIFSSAGKQPRMGDWQGITLMNYRHSCVIDYAVIEYAYNGLNIKKSNPQIMNSQIQFNYNAGIAVELQAKPKIIGNIISENGYAGIICNTGARPVLTDNMITKNELGLINFGTALPNLGNLQKGADYNIGRNGILDNHKYNIYNHSIYELKAENDTWGSKKGDLIAVFIYDNADDKKYGPVDTEPIMGSQLNIDQKILLSQATNQTKRTEAPKPQQNLPKGNSNASPKPKPETQGITTKALQTFPEKMVAKVEKPKEKLAADSAVAAVSSSPKDTVLAAAPQGQGKAVGRTVRIVRERPRIDFNQVFLDAFLDGGRVILKKVRPVIDDPSRGLGAHGRIIVRVVVNRMGRVDSARVLRGLNPYYDLLATEAAKEFLFKPGTIKGNPVRFSSSLIFDF